MANMDIFNADPFRAVSMTKAVDRLGHVPAILGDIPGLFEPVRVRTTDVFIEERGSSPALIQTDERGAPPRRRTESARSVRSFKTTRISQADTLTADQVAGIRAFGTETELQQVQQEVARKQMLCNRNIQLTKEHMRLGAVQGIVVDADGSVIYDWAGELGQTIPTEIDFDLDAADPESGIIRKKCNQVSRSITRNLQGMGGGQVRIMGLCGDDFWDDMTAHPEVRETYLNTQEAADLREGNAWESFRYGSITFSNYRGTDDGSTVAVPPDKCKFFPVGAGIFQRAQAPAETFDFVNTPGQDMYSWLVRDRDRNAWVDIEMYTYPLYVCVQPSALHRARRT